MNLEKDDLLERDSFGIPFAPTLPFVLPPLLLPPPVEKAVPFKETKLSSMQKSKTVLLNKPIVKLEEDKLAEPKPLARH